MPADPGLDQAVRLARARFTGLSVEAAKRVAPEQCEACAGDLVVFAGPLARLGDLGARPAADVDRLVLNPGTFAALGLGGTGDDPGGAGESENEVKSTRFGVAGAARAGDPPCA